MPCMARACKVPLTASKASVRMRARDARLASLAPMVLFQQCGIEETIFHRAFALLTSTIGICPGRRLMRAALDAYHATRIAEAYADDTRHRLADGRCGPAASGSLREERLSVPGVRAPPAAPRNPAAGLAGIRRSGTRHCCMRPWGELWNAIQDHATAHTRIIRGWKRTSTRGRTRF